MRQLLYSLLLLFAFALPATAQQIKIDKAHHIENVGDGYCGHCCIETIGRHYGYQKVYGRVKTLHEQWGDFGGGMRDDEIMTALQDYGIPYYSKPRGTYDYSWLNWACQNKYPCIVNWRPPQGSNVGHYVTLVGFYSDYVAVVDCNKSGTVRWYTRAAFANMWTGGFILVYPKTE
jgi:hypothetical protein